MKQTIAIIVAAGRGARAGDGGPKQYRLLAGVPILARTALAMLDHRAIDRVRIIIHRDDRALYDQAMNGLHTHAKLMDPVFGGAERQDSVRLGLESLSDFAPAKVLIHDAARPFVDDATIGRVVAALDTAKGAIAALPVFDTLKQANADRAETIATISHTVARDRLWRAQTPQGFTYSDILNAHRAAAGQTLTDDAAVAEAAGIAVALIAGAPDNMKITQAEDFGMAEILLARRGAAQDTDAHTQITKATTMWEFRTGQGFDVHAFEDGNSVFLCGVSVPHTHKLKGHSDADVGMHALTDAILGAIGQGDIGDHFPPSDPQWKGADSEIFLKKACALVGAAGGTVTHCDITLICEAPKIGPHRDAMRAALSTIMRVPATRISVKATTTECLGFTGRREGIAAIATATVRLPMNVSAGHS